MESRLIAIEMRFLKKVIGIVRRDTVRNTGLIEELKKTNGDI